MCCSFNLVSLLLQYQNRLMLDVFGDGPLLGGIPVRHHGVVVGWLCEVADFLCCNPESLHLAVNLLDRCLVEMPTIRLSSLQLLAVSCMWIATSVSSPPPSLQARRQITGSGKPRGN